MKRGERLSGWQRIWRVATRGPRLGLLFLSLVFLADPNPRVRLVALFGISLYFGLLWYEALHPERETPPEQGEEPTLSLYSAELAAAEAARARIAAALSGPDRSLARLLSPIQQQADQVVQRLQALVQRLARIDAFLSRRNPEEIRNSLAALESQIAATRDEFTRQQYLQAHEVRKSELRDYDELQLCAQRARAQIINALTTLEAAEAKVIKLQTADLQNAGLVRDSVTSSLQALSQEMAGFQESLDATLALRAR